jgi:transcriptional regulator with XRE-family HTH domain
MEALKRWLEENNLSQDEFAKRVGVTPGCVSHWLKGLNHPRGERLKKLHQITGLTTDQLLGVSG